MYHDADERSAVASVPWTHASPNNGDGNDDVYIAQCQLVMVTLNESII